MALNGVNIQRRHLRVEFSLSHVQLGDRVCERKKLFADKAGKALTMPRASLAPYLEKTI